MELVMKAIIYKEKNAALVNSNGLTEANMLENLTIIIYTEKEHILGAIKEYSKEIGKIIRWMGKEFLFGQIGENTQASIKMTKNTVTESSNGILTFYNLLIYLLNIFIHIFKSK